MGKIWKMTENIETLNLKQQKKEKEFFSIRNKLYKFHTIKFFTENLLAIEMRKEGTFYE